MTEPKTLGGKTLATVGCLALLIGAVSAAPASLAAPALSRAGQLSYQRIDGTIWAGTVRGASVNGFRLGDVSFTLRPSALFTGALKVDVEASGGSVTGGGEIGVRIDGRAFSLRDVAVDVDLGAIDRYTLFGLPYEGSARASVRRFEWGRAGCVAADASFWTDALNAAAKRLTGDGVELSGPIRCDGDRVALKLGGENAYGDATIDVAVSADLTYELAASVLPKKAEARRSLELLGFEADGQSLVYGAVGPIKGLGS